MLVDLLCCVSFFVYFGCQMCLLVNEGVRDRGTIKKAAAGHLSDTMYRGRLSLGEVIESYKDISIKDLSDSITRGRRYSAGSCSESCESMTLDLFDQ